MKFYRLAYIASGICAYAALIEAKNGDAWWTLLFAALAVSNFVIGAKNERNA